MIFGNIKDWKKNGIFHQDAFVKAFAFLEKNVAGSIENDTYEIDGKAVYAMVMEKTTEPIEKRAPEAHVKYIDIQFVISGTEKMGFAVLSDQPVIKEDKLVEKDVVLFENEIMNESFAILSAGDYAVFYPEDVHRPLCQVENSETVKKIVVKIKA
ncbi:YhcH/YjgK/YiaL family protein [Fusibacter sp. 3D3]|uniref:YhcH/YjgK/YiaL family protein n=1 Tax=Fusibacter sp. 3D3 TaxID=1048380 RepID=UPI00085357FF|nr:YhcH/YjgK/YiaL family protein [Fusibacter sp. 3D3]GAU75702.1 putative sugar isomerase involved in processing of exogenous sialic acid [Fusibacter sp. 3D3]